jgi:hypothetical protein
MNKIIKNTRKMRIPPSERTHIPLARRTTWEKIVGRPSAFVQSPPLKFQFEDFQGDQVIVRLMKHSEKMIVWNVEIQEEEDFSRYYTLTYWKKPSVRQEYINRQLLLKSDLRWADSMTETRHEAAIDDYNPIMDMLEEIGIDIGETFN